MSKKISEAEIEAYFVKCVEKDLGGVALKLEVKGRRGWPDRLAILPNGEVDFVELKTERGGLSAAQQKRADTLVNLNQRWYILCSLKAVDKWVLSVKNHTL
jgi:hypothetical protein|tara:strand:- start:362 stop:664 length:303 start_codon:yes stop_codon:yes gene_type:complete